MTSLTVILWLNRVSTRPVHITHTTVTGISSGFTANVSCALQTLTNTTSPAVSWRTDSVATWTQDLAVNNINLSNITWLEAKSDCLSWYLSKFQTRIPVAKSHGY
jgi:hypothetical protein